MGATTSRERAFTLVEQMAAIAIIEIIAELVAPPVPTRRALPAKSARKIPHTP
ncbi:MAG: hypothetical protein IT208_16315 [Chthonomonadales bacterium]|nr:hypothetical protein [Chthonomonadales bacterium]